MPSGHLRAGADIETWSALGLPRQFAKIGSLNRFLLNSSGGRASSGDTGSMNCSPQPFNGHLDSISSLTYSAVDLVQACTSRFLLMTRNPMKAWIVGGWI